MSHQFFSMRVPLILYCMVGLGFIFQGVRYLGAEQIMPYHLQVVGTSWQNMSPDLQMLLVGLLRGFGAGSLCTGLAIILLTTMPFRAGRGWARWSIPAIAGSYAGLLLYVTNTALLPGAVPIKISAVVLGMVLVAALSSIVGVRLRK